MNIAGKITGLKYKILMSDDPKDIDAENFDINANALGLFADRRHACFCRLKMGYAEKNALLSV